MVLVVQGVDGREGLGVCSHLDEAESSASTCLSVHNHLRASHFAEWGGSRLCRSASVIENVRLPTYSFFAHLQPPLGSGIAIPCSDPRSTFRVNKESGRTGRPATGGQGNRF